LKAKPAPTTVERPESQAKEPARAEEASVRAEGKKKRKLSGEKLRAARKAEKMAEKRAARQAAARAANEAANPSKQKRQKERPATEVAGSASAPAPADSAPAPKRRPASREGSPRVQSVRAQSSQSSRPSRPAQRNGSRTPAARIAIAAALAVGLMLVFWVLFKMPAPGAQH
jgi:hypothetical protein